MTKVVELLINKANRYTLLTPDPVSKWSPDDSETPDENYDERFLCVRQQELEKQREKNVVLLLCEAWVESLQSQSINFTAASLGLRDVIDTCVDNGKITEEYASSLWKRFLPQLLPHIDCRAKKNGKPSGLVKLAELSEPVLKDQDFNTSREHKNSLYSKIESTFQAYGVRKNGKAITASAIRSWIEK